ncbi:PadR family transcriptional regulator [Amycolatopsis suaedae]|uniref:PadR family transcriptional regulator n=1 Tax=Amycolatopsis suaedae TaxID=2510978 RepID=A0A4Q7JEH8_9PSEU|nr:helix-turn-helix transcriptional regulator [Amycolatopsis suaedae]RZQ65582.1 PadR family transcriptional regulator [Amycolatopsis suaedae]
MRVDLDMRLLSVLEGRQLSGHAVVEALGGPGPAGAVYPALRRLERAGYLTGEWARVGERTRRVYRLTGAGQRSLATARTAARGGLAWA